ncbi:armadillo-type protein [Mycotypha africana]|uniref:armadillo-type protein n=1 Tax=Mycotypha africana TaxID=64632 RepID=UPI0023006509|nr:armadillo-type protein [Mycotypha africana]KAI8988168.1 armadillo-type protein [Mycotypha africana]
MDIDVPMDSQVSILDTQIEDEIPVLVFPESLVTKGLRIQEQILLLQILHKQLKELDQNVDKTSLERITRELVDNKFMKTKNGTISALVACCLADVIRLHAPKSPYTFDLLRNVFILFVNELRQFGQETSNFSYHFYLLENLQSVKTFLLLTEMNDTDEIVLPMIEDFFKVAERAVLPRNVEFCMTDIIIQMIEDVNISAPELTELILEQFDKYEKGSTNPAFVMASDICHACPHAMQRKVCQYFSDVLLRVSNATEDSEDFEEARKIHVLIRKINIINPDLLLNVLPLLQEEMAVDHSVVRHLATDTVGTMFADPSSNLREKYTTTWKTWLGRRNDKDIKLRIRWLELCIDIYKNHPETILELNGCFKEKLADPDDKIRAEVCKILKHVGMETNVRILDKSLLEAISTRAKDKKNSVRIEAMNTLGFIYDAYYTRIQANDKTVIDKVGWIPDYMLSTLYNSDPSIMMNLEQTLNQYILSENENDQERAIRLVTVASSFQPRQKTAFTALIRKQKHFNTQLQNYVEMCRDYLNDNDSEYSRGKLVQFMKYLADYFSDKARTFNALRSFLERKDKNALKLLGEAVDINRTYKQILTAKAKLLDHLDEDQLAIVEVFQAILNKACPLIINKSITAHLLTISRETTGRRHSVSTARAVVAQEILKEISVSYPSLMMNSVKTIMEEIMSDNDNISNVGLEQFAEFCKSSTKEKVQYQDNMIERLTAVALEGDEQQAENASVALANMYDAEVVFADLVSDISDGLLLDSHNLSQKLTSLAQFALYSPSLISPVIDSIIRFVEKDLLTAKTTTFVEENPEWRSFDELPKLSQQKLLGIRILVNYLTACKDDVHLQDIVVQQIFSVLWDLTDRTCEAAVADNLNAAETSHMRLGASQAIVKLTHYSKYINQLTVSNFERLAITLQDPCYYVRQEFAETIMKGLQTRQLHSRYYAVLFICAHEPEVALLKQVKSFIQKNMAALKATQENTFKLDASLVRLVHLLAHHPDFTEAIEDLQVFAQYFKFYFNCVATADNVSFLYHVLQKIKLSKDMVAEELSKNSYVLSDLAGLIVKTKCKESSWPLNAYEGHISLHSRLYSPLPTGPVQNETIKKTYLPKEYLEIFNEEQKQKTGEKRSRFNFIASNKKVKV